MNIDSSIKCTQERREDSPVKYITPEHIRRLIIWARGAVRNQPKDFHYRGYFKVIEKYIKDKLRQMYPRASERLLEQTKNQIIDKVTIMISPGKIKDIIKQSKKRPSRKDISSGKVFRAIYKRAMRSIRDHERAHGSRWSWIAYKDHILSFITNKLRELYPNMSPHMIKRVSKNILNKVKKEFMDTR